LVPEIGGGSQILIARIEIIMSNIFYVDRLIAGAAGALVVFLATLVHKKETYKKSHIVVDLTAGLICGSLVANFGYDIFSGFLHKIIVINDGPDSRIAKAFILGIIWDVLVLLVRKKVAQTRGVDVRIGTAVEEHTAAVADEIETSGREV